MSICTRGISNQGLIATAGLGREQYELPPLPPITSGSVGVYLQPPPGMRERPDDWLLLVIAQLIAAHQIH
jgi:hypothetical protein